MTRLSEALRDLNEEKVLNIVEEMLKQGVPYIDIVKECNEGMVAVGTLFETKQYFLSELMFSAAIMKRVMHRLEAVKGAVGMEQTAGTVVIGTVEGDIHDIGKNIVIDLLRSNGFQVIDLGVNVPAGKFVEAVRTSGAKVLGLSALLNYTYPEMKKVVDSIASAGLRNQVAIIIGGTICSEKVREFTGADYYASDAVAGVNICKKIYS